MAEYHYRGPSLSLFAAQGDRSFASRILYRTGSEFALLNADGSKTYFKCKDLVWNAATSTFTGGVVESISHYTASGAYVDGIQDLSIPISVLQSLLDGRGTSLEVAALRDALLAGDDTITSETSNDTLYGGGGNDAIAAGTGNDRLYGGSGDDVLVGGAGADLLSGGIGTDWASYTGSTLGVIVSLVSGLGSGGDALGDTLASIENLRGSKAGDALTGNGLANILFGLEGNDTLSGRAGHDRLLAGDGNDNVSGGTGQDIIKGSSGNDNIHGGDGDDVAVYDYAWCELIVTRIPGTNGFTVSAPDGTDKLSCVEFIATTTGTYRFDRMTGAWTFDSERTGSDWLGGVDDGSRANPPSRVYAGTSGNDTFTGNDSDNIAYGKDGADTLMGNGGDDHIYGGNGSDFIIGGEGVDVLEGGGGDDLIDAGTGRDIVRGGAGNDTIYGGPDPDIIIYDYAWSEITATYTGSDYSIWIVAPDGTDHVFSALTIATTTGTYYFDVPSQTWVYQSAMTGDDWLA
jgi:Ca2+-binding RTX toxin-like protein